MGQGYDIIGDVHGRMATLLALVDRLGYCLENSHWYHPAGRLLISVGDLLDDGPKPLDCLELIEQMTDDGCAAMVLGNHELNALHYMADPPLRPHNVDHRKQFAATLAQIDRDPSRWERARRFLERVPTRLQLEDDRLRIIHASWDEATIDQLPLHIDTEEKLRRTSSAPEENRAWNENRDPDLEAGLKSAADPWFVAVEQCIKGIELPCEAYQDQKQKWRYKERVAWWTGYNGLPGIVFGHYKFPWTGRRSVLTPAEPGWIGGNGRVACLDFSAHAGRMLTALRWPEDQFVTIDILAADLEDHRK